MMFSYTVFLRWWQIRGARWLAVISCLIAVSYEVRAQDVLPSVELKVGHHVVQAELASTHEQHEKGLMQRPSLPDNTGMLFVFDRPQAVCFWMKNTWIPLTAAFMLDDGTVSQLAHMTPNSEQAHCSRIPVRYVLEVNQGWFEIRRLGPGVRFEGGPFQGSHQ